jgi:hypothetical protein
MNTSRSRRGQAAMEYLMTYGWAILIVLAIMGILVYLVKPQQVESCNIATPLQCETERYIVDTAGNLNITIANIGSVGYYITNTTCAGKLKNYNVSGDAGFSLPAGGDANVYFNCSNSPNLVSTAVSGKDTFHESNLTITYYPVGSPAFAKTQVIEVVVKYK